MSKTESTMLALGTKAPDFHLQDVTTKELVSLNDSKNAIATVLLFICNHCPYVKYINPQLTDCANEYIPKGIRFIAINSNDVINYPDDSPEYMIQTAKTEKYPFPYLFDESQAVAKSYHAACTPDFFVFNKELSLVYRGQFDDSRPGNNIATTGSSLRLALDCLLTNQPLTMQQRPSMGCNIKWKN